MTNKFYYIERKIFSSKENIESKNKVENEKYACNTLNSQRIYMQNVEGTSKKSTRKG